MLIACSKVWVVLRNCKVTSSLKPGQSAGLFHWQIKRPTRCVPEPPPNSQHAPVLRSAGFQPARTDAGKMRRLPALPARNPPRPTATPPRRGVFPIPSLEGCRVSGGVGCPLPGPLRLGSGQASNLMQGSNLGFRVWALAFYLLSTGIKGTSSMKLHRDLGITQKSAALVST